MRVIDPGRIDNWPEEDQLRFRQGQQLREMVRELRQADRILELRGEPLRFRQGYLDVVKAKQAAAAEKMAEAGDEPEDFDELPESLQAERESLLAALRKEADEIARVTPEDLPQALMDEARALLAPPAEEEPEAEPDSDPA